jgi:hypothetical protein
VKGKVFWYRVVHQQSKSGGHQKKEFSRDCFHKPNLSMDFRELIAA